MDDMNGMIEQHQAELSAMRAQAGIPERAIFRRLFYCATTRQLAVLIELGDGSAQLLSRGAAMSTGAYEARASLRKPPDRMVGPSNGKIAWLDEMGADGLSRLWVLDLVTHGVKVVVELSRIKGQWLSALLGADGDTVFARVATESPFAAGLRVDYDVQAISLAQGSMHPVAPLPLIFG